MRDMKICIYYVNNYSKIGYVTPHKGTKNIYNRLEHNKLQARAICKEGFPRILSSYLCIRTGQNCSVTLAIYFIIVRLAMLTPGVPYNITSIDKKKSSYHNDIML